MSVLLKRVVQGTGKSVLIREIIRWAGRVHRIVFVTASTGMAAVNIGGMTLHSWAGCGLCKRPTNYYVKQISQGNNAAERWMGTQLLIIDESLCHKIPPPRFSLSHLLQVSMINSAFFDKLVGTRSPQYRHTLILTSQEFIARHARSDHRPFGGIQVLRDRWYSFFSR